jgi:membrane protease YdiL (CAAX protease family)
MIIAAFLYLAVIAAIEIVGIVVGVVPSLLGHVFLIIVLLGQYALADQLPYRRILLLLALASLLRILSFAIPLKQVSQLYWYVMIGLPFLIAVGLVARTLGFSWERFASQSASWLWQSVIAFSGVPLSIIAFLLVRPRALVSSSHFLNLLVAIVILLVFTGFLEEVFFRGVLLQVANEIFGRMGLLYSSLLFAIMYISSLSWPYVLFVGLVGLFFGWCVNRTRSVWGVSVAHGLISIGMLLIWPVLWH